MMLTAQRQMAKEAGETTVGKSRQALRMLNSVPACHLSRQSGEEQQEPPRGGEVLLTFK